jgi:outer membrane protein, heavy metal efflux system
VKLQIIVALATAVGLTACTPAVLYHPQPIAPAATAARLESRTLADPGLEQFMKGELAHALPAWPPQSWDLNDLTLASYYFNPQMEVARAQAQAAEAAVMTAGERPNPTLSLAPGIPSPYLFDLVLNFPVQRGGRRAIKIRRANALSAAASYAVAATAWKVRSGVRAAALDFAVSQERADLAEREAGLRSQQEGWLAERLAAGEAARPEVAAAQLQLLDARLALRTADGRVPEARTALAAAIGVPVSALDGIKFSLTAFDRPPDAKTLSSEIIQREAVLNRLDVREALAQYHASQAELQLEIARQYPNFSLGPGYQFEESHNYFTLTFSTILPIFNRNQGPIAEAEARRKQAAANFLETQARAIAQSEEALARYRAAFAALEEAQKSTAQIQQVQEPMAARAVSFGESDKLFLNSVRLEGAAAVATQFTALYAAQQALGQLEDAVERPVGEER